MEKTEILMKLISLANNNPNDNEANAAARRVCKMLAEMKVNFITKKPVVTQPPFTRPAPVSEDMFDILREMMNREARYNPWAYENPFSNQRARQQSQQRAPETERRKEKVTRECADCGGKHMTRCEGVFYCNKCQWRRYQENKAKQSHG
jgi:hypothetical protein